MRYKITILILLMASVAYGTEVRAYADANDCTQLFYSPPNWAEPNFVRGVILPAVVDPNTGIHDFNTPTGKLVRTGSMCDPGGDPIGIVCDTPGWTVSVGAASLVWTLSGDVKPGPNYILVTAKDDPGPYRTPETVYYTILIFGLPPENHGPVLH